MTGDLEKMADDIERETRRLAAERARKSFRPVDGGKPDEWPNYRRRVPAREDFKE